MWSLKPSGAHARTLAVLAQYIRLETLTLFRSPSFSIPNLLLFPTMVFAIFGLPNMDKRFAGMPDTSAYLLATYGACSVMQVALFSFSSSIALERTVLWDRLLRTSPMSAAVHFSAKIFMALLFGIVALAVLFVFSAVVTHTVLPARILAPLVPLLLLGMVPFAALGILIGYLFHIEASPGIANLVFIPAAFFSGLLVPFQLLPEIVQRVSPFLPSYHGAQLAWWLVGGGAAHRIGSHVLWLVVFTAVVLLLAYYAYRRDEGRSFG